MKALELIESLGRIVSGLARADIRKDVDMQKIWIKVER